MNAKLLRTCGRTLLAAFVITVVAVLFPLNLAEPSWGLRLSTLVVDAASLPLVALLLMRYAAHLEKESAQAQPLQEEDKKMMRLGAVADPLKGLRQLAYKGFVLLILLAIWQFVLAFASLDRISYQNLELSQQIEARFQAVEGNIKIAPGEAISKAWIQSQPKGTPIPTLSEPEIATQKSDILKNVKAQKLQATQNLEAQSSTAQFNLAKDIIRIILMAIIYAWGFYGIARL